MNMNDKDWDGEFWDDEPDADDGDDDEYNGFDNNIDANNDETFDNAAEWNEDEHEELIARDSILSQTNRTSRNNHNHAVNSNNGINILNSINNNENSNSRSQNNAGLNDLLRGTANNGNNSRGGSNRMTVSANTPRPAGTSAWNTSGDVDDFPSLTETPGVVRCQMASDMAWSASITANDRLHQLQMQQRQMLMQSKLENQEHLRQQQIRERQIQALQQQQREQQQQQHHHQLNLIQRATQSSQAEPGPQILRVDDLERQLRKTNISQATPLQQASRLAEMSKRSGWSPFGGKDLFTTPDQDIIQVQADLSSLLQQSQSMDLEQQQRLIIQQHQLLQRQQQQLQQLASLQQQHLQQQQQQHHHHQQQQQHQQQANLLPQGKCLTVEELERQMLADKKQSSRNEEIESKKRPEMHYAFLAMEVESPHHGATKSTDRQRNNTHDRRNGDRHERFDRHQRDGMDSRDHKERREHRNNNRENQHRHHGRGSIIIPPQVQRSVIDHAKKSLSIPKMNQYEFLQDKMPTKSDGFRMKEHMKVASEKIKHDGVLTEKERNWLTRIQEKIQADYDDNLDQDYYYLLYFNRSSMTNEAAQKPVGPGVSDRRFIPRERLLYNSGV